MLLFGLLFTTLALAKQGYIQQTTDGKFLSCNTDSCSWTSTPTQAFRRDSGDDGQYRFHILNADGSDTGQCLDREHCHKGSSNARMADCNHCGAVHWNYDDSSHKMAEDDMKNCIQSSGAIDHCSQSHTPVKWPIAEDCDIDYQTITDLKCVTSNTDGTCGADFAQGSTVGGHSETDCNACNAAPNSTLACQFTLAVTAAHTYATTFSSATKIGVQAGVKFAAGIVFEKAEASVSFSIDETLTTGHTTSDTTTTSIASACTGTIQQGTREAVTANFLSGTLTGTFTATVTTYWKDCPWKDNDVDKTAVGTVTISNVPTKTIVGSCEPINVPCTDDDRYIKQSDGSLPAPRIYTA